MMDKLAALEERYNELSQELARPDVITDPVRLQQVAREHASLEPIISLYRQLRDSDVAIAETRELLHDGHDPELVELAREELRALEERREQLLQELRGALLPRDPNDEKDVIVEIRAAAGGEEAALFARDLFRMYTRYAEQQGWKVNVLSMNETGLGGIKEVIFEVSGYGAYSRLKYESGVHRVQRIPVTESSGRIHTSTATVIVLPKPEEVEIEIRPEDLRIEVFRSTGHGGQSVNTTDSAVRITHLPTGITASSQDERSQLQNRANAMAVLRARLYDLERRRREAEQGAARRSQVQSGDRSEKIRTYNFPQDRVTDHRIGLTLHNLQAVLDGEIGELIELLATADRAEKLQTVAST
jgi:peptide chain release factor 1